MRSGIIQVDITQFGTSTQPPDFTLKGM